VRDVLKARGVDYTPLVYSAGLFDRCWGRYRAAMETHWESYVQGRITLDEAIDATIKTMQ
jgi:hypothetical protein